jgi:hypothetical protein
MEETATSFIPDKVEVNVHCQELLFEPNVNRLMHPFRMIISGPSMSGKSFFMHKLVKYRNEIFTTRFHRIMFCIPPESLHQKSPFFNALKIEFPAIELILGLPKEENVLDNSLPKLILIGKLFLHTYKQN